MRWIALALVVMLALSGCSYLSRGPREEKLVVSNQSSQAVSVILRITTSPGGIPIFSEEVFVERGETREFATAFAPGFYQASITTTNGLSELIGFEIPSKGNVRVQVDVFRGRASISVLGG